MPVFINEVVIRSDLQRAREPVEGNAGMQATGIDNREALIAEVTQAVIDKLERELDRVGER